MKKNIRKIAALGLCMSMVFATGCSDKGNEKKGGTESTSEKETVVSTVKRDIDYGDKKEARIFEGLKAEDSSIFVSAIDGMTDEFMRGVDISSYIAQKDSGVKYYDYDGNELTDAGFFNFLADNGVNWVRVRVWNDPYDSKGNGYGGGNNDVDKAIAIGKLATNAGMKVMIDFHYSDFWADPAKQFAPKDWAHKLFDDKLKALSEYTEESVAKIYDAGVDVGMIQIGNETNSGMSGEKDSAKVYQLMKAGSDAIRKVSKDNKKDVLIAVHYTNPESADYVKIAGNIIDAGVDFDVFASSYYPFWHGTLENLTNKLKSVADTYDKKVLVAETSYLYTDSDGDGFGNSVSTETEGIKIEYDISAQGQANEVKDVIQAVKNVGDAGLGVFYWEPAWIPVNKINNETADKEGVLAKNKDAWEKDGSGWASSYSAKYDADDAGKYYGGSSWDNQAMFDFDGKPLESLKVFKYIFTGTTGENELFTVPDIEVEAGIGSKVELPEQVDAVMIDASKEPISVKWDEKALSEAEIKGAGDYEIAGVATDKNGKEHKLVCNLHIKKINYIKNEGFEDADMSMWTIMGEGVERTQDNNMHSGEYSLKFYSEDKVEWTAEQKIDNIPAGFYELASFVQGGDAGSNALFEMYIVVNGNITKAETGVTSWKNFSNPVIKGIQIPENAEVTVGVKVSAAPKAWGAWDDFTLYSED